MLAVVAFILVGNAVSWLLGQNIVTGFQRDIYRSAGAAGMSAAVVAGRGGGDAGQRRELLFRGFLFRGWHRTPRDAWIVIIVTALLWAVIHVQYDLFVIGQVFGCGLMLGWFRWATGSTLLTMLMHALVNAEGMLETLFTAHN